MTELFVNLYNNETFALFLATEAKKGVIFSILLPVIVLCLPLWSSSQDVPQNFGNNASSVEWMVEKTDHFIITYPRRYKELQKNVAIYAEQAYQEFKDKLGIAPKDKIELYLNDEDEITSDARSISIDSYKSIWHTNAYMENFTGRQQTVKSLVRYEVAYVFQQKLHESDIGAWKYLFSQPEQDPWSDGLPAYLVEPSQTDLDVRWMRNYWLLNEDQKKDTGVDEFNAIMKGRSQLQSFVEESPEHSLKTMYSYRQSLFLGIDYFDFDPAFRNVTGQSYSSFAEQWKQVQKERVDQQKEQPNARLQASPDMIKPGNYTGIKIGHEGSIAAAISLPGSGRLLQTLSVIENPGTKSEQSHQIDRGIFHPVMSWNPVKDELVYSKRIFGDEGNYHNELFIAGAEGKPGTALTSGKHALLTAFSSDGEQIAYVSKKQGSNAIFIKTFGRAASTELNSLSRGATVEYLDWHPSRSQLLVSYFVSETDHRLGLIDVSNDTFKDLQISTGTPLNAHWGTEGQKIYFNGMGKGVTNIFAADVSNPGLTNIKSLTGTFEGTDLMDIAEFPSSGETVIAKSSTPEAGLVIAGISVNASDKISTNTSASIAHNKLIKAGQASTGLTSAGSNHVRSKSYSYNSFSNIRLDRAILFPYFLNPNDFGTFGLIRFIEPMRTHQLTIGGIYSAPSLFSKSTVFVSYINNMFKPRLEVNWQHLPSASDLLGKSLQVQTTDVVAVNSLWRIQPWSSLTTDWYFGMMLRHIALDYYPEASMELHHPDILLNNTKTRQTDLRLSLAWRNYEPYKHNVIYPIDGAGLRTLITGSDKILGSQSRYIRLDVTGYSVLSAFDNHTFYLYGRSVLQQGEAVGRDYIAFTQNSRSTLGLPEFTGSESPDVTENIRGYGETVLGERLLAGTIEYRVPLRLESSKRLLGFIPPARTSLAWFADGGILWEARKRGKSNFTEKRLSTGVELKRVFRLGEDFTFSYSLGAAKALDDTDAPRFYFGLKSTIPF